MVTFDITLKSRSGCFFDFFFNGRIFVLKRREKNVIYNIAIFKGTDRKPVKGSSIFRKIRKQTERIAKRIERNKG
jgi:hypothetical protein